jgi:hypothetical protein
MNSAFSAGDWSCSVKHHNLGGYRLPNFKTPFQILNKNRFSRIPPVFSKGGAPGDLKTQGERTLTTIGKSMGMEDGLHNNYLLHAEQLESSNF